MTALRDIVAAESARETFPAAAAFAARLAQEFGPSAAAVLFYGSCLRQKTDEGLMLDFYVLVDGYRAALRHPVSAFFARLLPPNVYYREMPFEGRTVRAKVAVLSVAQFLRGTGPGCFASSLWARFAQPAVIMHARNGELRRRLAAALTAAVETMIRAALPLMDDGFTARGLWIRALAETYGAELRPEPPGKAAELVEAELARYESVTAAVLGAPNSAGRYAQAAVRAEQSAARRAWAMRRVQGKALNALRLIKAAFTFKGGLDYAVWKIERHSGVKITLTESQRRWPLLTGLNLLWSTLRRGGLR